MRLLALILMLIPSWGWAEGGFYVSEGARLKDLPPMYVLITDHASDGCWTNIKETKNYAEGKLEIAGANLSFKGDKQGIPWEFQGSAFHIAVYAERHDTRNFCFGNITIQTMAATKSYKTGLFGVQIYSNVNSIFVSSDNVNNRVLDIVKEVIEAWAARN